MRILSMDTGVSVNSADVISFEYSFSDGRLYAYVARDGIERAVPILSTNDYNYANTVLRKICRNIAMGTVFYVIEEEGE